ncbi:hypothetical protein ACMA55_004676 [Salmonella enterica subsp. enterica serovar Newport]
MQALNERITSLDSEIAALSSQQIAYRHLLTIPGVGPLIAAAFISEQGDVNIALTVGQKNNSGFIISAAGK